MKIGKVSKSKESHEKAYQLAKQMSSLNGQTIALGNLGRIGNLCRISSQEKLETFVKKYIEVS